MPIFVQVTTNLLGREEWKWLSRKGRGKKAEGRGGKGMDGKGNMFPVFPST